MTMIVFSMQVLFCPLIFEPSNLCLLLLIARPSLKARLANLSSPQLLPQIVSRGYFYNLWHCNIITAMYDINIADR